MIYFVTQGSQFIKIGHVSGSPSQRLGALQVGNPVRLKLVMILEGDKGDEKKVHGIFMSAHVRGEWFFLTREIEEQLEDWQEYCILEDFKSSVPKGSGQFAWLRKGKMGVHRWD